MSKDGEFGRQKLLGADLDSAPDPTAEYVRRLILPDRWPVLLVRFSLGGGVSPSYPSSLGGQMFPPGWFSSGCAAGDPGVF